MQDEDEANVGRRRKRSNFVDVEAAEDEAEDEDEDEDVRVQTHAFPAHAACKLWACAYSMYSPDWWQESCAMLNSYTALAVSLPDCRFLQEVN